VWALAQLLSADAFAKLARHHAKNEEDPAVQNEWRVGLGGSDQGVPEPKV